MKRTVWSLLVLGLWAASDAAVCGRVIDGAGKPVFDAMVTYTDLDNRLIYVYTNTEGRFCIPAPSEWCLDDLPMYKSRSGTVGIVSAGALPRAADFGLRRRGAVVDLQIRQGGSRVVAELFDPAGRRVSRLIDRPLTAGEYRLAPFAAGQRVLPAALYLLRVRVGQSCKTISLLNVCPASGTIRSKNGPGEADGVRRLARSSAAVDGLRAGKTGYRPAVVTLNSYEQDLGDLAIHAIDIERKVDSLLELMSTDQKIGQTVQASSNMAQSYFTANHIGSFLKGGSYNGTKSLQEVVMGAGLKIPMTVGTDYVHGGPKIYFPHNIGLGAAGDSLLTELAYRITAMNCLVRGNNVDFAPCIDVPRDDRHGRVYEGWSEATADAVVMARASIRGLQGTDLSSGTTMIATAKHFAGAGGTFDGKVFGQTNTGDWSTLCRIHLPQFRAAVEAGAASVMTAYNSFLTSSADPSLIQMTAHAGLITDTLKNGWKFDGFVITDYNQVFNPGVRQAINAGQDVAMIPDNTDKYIAEMKALVADGSIPIARLDDAVRRHLRVKFRMNLFEKPMCDQALDAYVASEEYREVARLAVAKSLVLLKNEQDVLPLDKAARIHVVGVWADNLGYQCGGWSETGGDAWQGSGTAHGISGATTLKEALTAASSGRVSYGATAAGIPADADVVVVAVGETTYAEEQGTWSDITLKADHQSLVASCAAAGKPVVTVIISGRPIPLGSVPDNSTALVAAWLPGTEGTGMADVLFGERDFEGRLRFCWPANMAQQPINTGSMGDRTGSGGEPLYPYGHGLSYAR